MALLHLTLLFAVPALLVGGVSLLLWLRRRGSPAPVIARAAPHPLTWVAASFDAPSFEIPLEFSNVSAGVPGVLQTMSMAHSFNCFLCAWTENGQLSNSPFVGANTFVAFAFFSWSLSGTANVTVANLGFTSPPTTTIDQPVTTLPLTDAKQAGCEVRGPGSLSHGRFVFE